MSRSTASSRVFPLLLATLVLLFAVPAVAQETQGGAPADFRSDRRAEGLTASFNAVTSPYKYLFVTGPIWVGQSNASPNCYSIDYAIFNPTAQTNQYLAELWGANTGGLLRTSGDVTMTGDSYSESGATWVPRTSIGSGCTTSARAFVIKIYSTSAALTPNLMIDFNTLFDTSYRVSNNLYLPSGAFQRSVITASFAFGSSAGVCATTPENAIKVPASKTFPGSPVFGDYGWQSSGTATNTDTCSGSAFSDLMLRSSANISGAGRWTFTYQVPNGLYEVTLLYNTASATAGDTTITLNGRPVVNAVTTAAFNLAQTSDRLNVGGNQILVGVQSATGTAVLNGVIITPVAQ